MSTEYAPSSRYETDPSDNEKEGRDTLGLYLERISKTPLLTAEQEVHLSIEIEAGLAAEAILKQDERAAAIERHLQLNVLHSEPNTEELLREVMRLGEQAKERMINSNLRYVVSIAKRHQERGVDFLDLIQEGNTGLIHAVEKFDYQKGFKFSTYAKWWILQAIDKAIVNQARIIRLPMKVAKRVRELDKARRRLTLGLGRAPSSSELALEMGVEESVINELEDYTSNPVPLDDIVQEGGIGERETRLVDFLADDDASQPDEYAIRNSLKAELASAIARHTDNERDRQVVATYFGLEGGILSATSEVIGSYGKVGKLFSIHSSQVKMIVQSTLNNIREHEPHLAEEM